MAVTVPDRSLEGVRYFLERAFELSLEDARNVLNLETTSNNLYYGWWHSAEAIYKQKVDRFPDHNWLLMPRECFIAVTCYTQDRMSVAPHLNAFCRVARPNASSWRQFPYKSLWCFLLRAFQMLPDFPVRRVFRVVQSVVETMDDIAVFAEFLCARALAGPPYNDSGPDAIHEVLYFVPSLLSRDISLYSVREDHQEVLIWPFCMFYVFRTSRDTLVLPYACTSLPQYLPGVLPAWPCVAV